MMNSFRNSLVEEHLFYVKQARKRLLSSFADMETEADKAGAEWLARAGRFFDPERHDPAAFEEEAEQEAIKFYGLLSDLREQTRLSVVAGMFHQWDKELRDWLTREIGHWHAGEDASSAVWGQKFDGVMDLLESIGWGVRDKPHYPSLDACRPRRQRLQTRTGRLSEETPKILPGVRA
jgi:hypothetical protein